MNREYAAAAANDDEDGHLSNETKAEMRDQRMLYIDRDIQRSSNLL